MDIQKPHPSWVEDERDFDCPACSKPLADKTDREHWDYDEKQTLLCPHCGLSIEVKEWAQ